ncbi:uncharacterized protein LOC126571588 [Anopheles aquasalis]|uniref:uncharacterized protein LOC126571588 n=1 Tax=Anopheles aquasalis TaxID=42839 RepID=UPI00215AD6AF|nr:uncharacterized protein LOC126571588 [Anopheles aquasalis]
MSSCEKCAEPDNDSMVACDKCGKWFHFACVGVDSSVEQQDWVCCKCAEESFETPKSGRIKPELLHEQTKPVKSVVQSVASGTRASVPEPGERSSTPPKSTVFEKSVFRSVVFESRFSEPRDKSATQPVNVALENGMDSAELQHELQFLEERQAMERRHLQERSQLRARYGVSEEVQANGSRPQSASTNLHQTQIAARQVVGKDLPSFSGNPEEWPLFIASFESSTRICGYTDDENLLRLQRSLKGKALEAVRCRLLHPRNLAGAISTLRTLFGRPECIIQSLINKIREMPNPRADKFNTLIDYGIAVQNICATIEGTGLSGYLYNITLLQELTEKLPPTIRLNWAYHRQTLQDVTMLDFGDWLNKLVEAASSVTLPGTAPDNASHLLLKFREFKYAIVGDIREMFFQVLMRPQDQRSQMILWNGGDPKKEPDTFIARRGAPVEIISDRGTNFIGASRELRDELKNVNENMLMNAFVGPDTTWKFNPPAAPHFGGCWERLVQPLTYLALESDSEPVLTPNHLLLGSSNGSKPPVAFDDSSTAVKKSWKMSQRVADQFWKKWVAEYLPTLTKRTKWHQPIKPIEVGDLALIADDNHPRNCWPMGRIVEAMRASDGQVRRVVVHTNSGLLERPATKIAILDVTPSVNEE